MVLGPSEAFTPEQLAEQYDVNVLGAQRLNRAALPHLRGRRSGYLIWVSSSSARGGSPPYLGPYFAAKAGFDLLAVTYAGGPTELEPPDSDPAAVGRAIAELVATPFGERPFRVTIDPADDGAEIVNAVSDRMRREMFEKIGLADLHKPAGASA